MARFGKLRYAGKGQDDRSISSPDDYMPMDANIPYMNAIDDTLGGCDGEAFVDDAPTQGMH